MIKFLENTNSVNKSIIEDICSDVPIYGTSILQKLLCYGDDWRSCSHWFGIDENNVAVYALCRYQNNYYIAVKPGLTLSEFVLEELAMFCEMQSFQTLEGGSTVIAPLRDLLNHQDYYSSITMKYNSNQVYSYQSRPDFKIIPCQNISDLYNLVCQGYQYFSENVPHDQFISNTYIQKRHGCIEVWQLISNDGIPITSGTLLTADKSNCATIATISTIPTMQGKGYAKEMVRFLCNRASVLNKKVFLNCGEESLTKLYHPLGFVSSGHWMVLE